MVLGTYNTFEAMKSTADLHEHAMSQRTLPRGLGRCGVSRGIGAIQQRILDELLAASDDYGLTVVELAKRIAVSDRQIRRAVYALADRELVVLTEEHGGWRGRGGYGRRVWRHRVVDDPQGNHIRYEGSHRGVPEEGDEIGGGPVWDDGTGWVLGTPVKCRYEWYAEMSATPTSASLFVWLPETRAKWAEHQHAIGGDAVEFGD